MSTRRFFGAAIVAICVGLPLVESFDSWDHSLRNDTESNVVVAALCVGVAMATATALIIVHLQRRRFCTGVQGRQPSSHRGISVTRLLMPVPTISPPSALRV